MSTADMKDAVDKCLGRDEGWLEFYNDSLESYQPVDPSTDDEDKNLDISLAEARFGEAMWFQDYVRAAKVLEAGLEDTFTYSRPTGAWHALWLGYCYELLGDTQRAKHMYARAHGANRNIPRHSAWPAQKDSPEFSVQAKGIADYLCSSQEGHVVLPAGFDTELTALQGNSDHKRVEAAIDSLGRFLGLDSIRPDNELNTGPDVLWSLDRSLALCIEAKTDKTERSIYSKQDIGQLRDHVQWTKDNTTAATIIPTFVGPLVAAGSDANPDSSIFVVELSQFAELGERLRSALIDICNTSVPAKVTELTHHTLIDRKLTFTQIVEGLGKKRLVDIN
jgi:tetratricopeptide (TPR) repeat protein